MITPKSITRHGSSSEGTRDIEGNTEDTAADHLAQPAPGNPFDAATGGSSPKPSENGGKDAAPGDASGESVSESSGNNNSHSSPSVEAIQSNFHESQAQGDDADVAWQFIPWEAKGKEKLTVKLALYWLHMLTPYAGWSPGPVYRNRSCGQIPAP